MNPRLDIEVAKQILKCIAEKQSPEITYIPGEIFSSFNISTELLNEYIEELESSGLIHSTAGTYDTVTSTSFLYDLLSTFNK